MSTPNSQRISSLCNESFSLTSYIPNPRIAGFTRYPQLISTKLYLLVYLCACAHVYVCECVYSLTAAYISKSQYTLAASPFCDGPLCGGFLQLWGQTTLWWVFQVLSPDHSVVDLFQALRPAHSGVDHSGVGFVVQLPFSWKNLGYFYLGFTFVQIFAFDLI